MAMLIRAATVLTMDPARPRANAVGIDGDRIVAVGDVEAVRRELPPDAEEIDAGAATVVPGFVDAHNHYLATAESFAGVEARDVTSIAELQRRVGEFAEQREPGTWIRGHGLEWSAFDEGRMPDRRDLDEVSRTHPILLEHVSGHAILVNSLAMELRGVGDDVRDPDGGTFDRDDRGRPTGIARDGATNLLLGPSVDIGHHGPNFHTELEVDEGVEMLAAAAPRYFAAGLTTIGDPQVSSRELGIYREAHRRGVPGPRIVAMPLSHQLDELVAIGLAGPFGDDRLRIGAMKFYTDGAITAGTAAFSEGLGPGRATGTFYHEPAAFRALDCPRARGGLAARGPHDGRPRLRPRPRRLRGRVPGVTVGGPAAQGRARDVPHAGPAPPDGLARRHAGDAARLDPRARQRLEDPARRADPRGDAPARLARPRDPTGDQLRRLRPELPPARHGLRGDLARHARRHARRAAPRADDRGSHPSPHDRCRPSAANGGPDRLARGRASSPTSPSSTATSSRPSRRASATWKSA